MFGPLGIQQPWRRAKDYVRRWLPSWLPWPKITPPTPSIVVDVGKTEDLWFIGKTEDLWEISRAEDVWFVGKSYRGYMGGGA